MLFECFLPSFPQIWGFGRDKEILVFWVVFLAFYPKNEERKDRAFPLKVGLRWVFVNGLKWVQKWVFGCKSG